MRPFIMLLAVFLLGCEESEVTHKWNVGQLVKTKLDGRCGMVVRIQPRSFFGTEQYQIRFDSRFKPQWVAHFELESAGDCQ